MNDIRERLIHIHQCRGVGWNTISKMLHVDRSLASIYHMTSTELASSFSMQKNHSEIFHQDLHTTDFSLYEQEGVQVVTILDDTYPKLLQQTYDPPWVLYFKGNLNILENEHLLSVVGTRYPSKMGVHTIKQLLAPLVVRNWGIVSGLANGIDAAAHEIGLQNSTVAVLGSGFHHIYPKSQAQLAKKIAFSHLLLSEYPPHQPPRPWQFPQRNRIISGLSKGTLVVEAKEKSGSLITADQALEQGREVFAVPGSINEPRSVGTNRLIQQGAKLVLNANDIIEEWPHHGHYVYS